MKPELSILIPHHNEGLAFIQDAVESIEDTIDVSYEIIIIDDGSRDPLPDMEGTTVIRHDVNRGVGAAFTTGAMAARADNLWIQGSDIRYIPNEWASKMIKAVDDNPKSVICTICVGLNTETSDGMNLEVRRSRSRRNGSNVLVYHDHISHPKKAENFRNIIECQWLPVNRTATGLVEIPCVLGAAYIVKKEWFDYMDPWRLHKSWGTLEPLLGMTSWLMGGSNLCNHDVETGHIFKRTGTHGTSMSHVVFNKLLAATLLFPEDLSAKLIDFLGSNHNLDQAKAIFGSMKDRIFAEENRYKSQTAIDIREWCNKFNIDLRE